MILGKEAAEGVEGGAGVEESEADEWVDYGRG